MSDQPISQSIAIRDPNKTANSAKVNDDRTLSVSIDGTSTPTDVDLTLVDGDPISLGQKTMAQSLPVAIASNQGNLPGDIKAVAGVNVVASTAPIPVGFYNPTGGALLDPTAPAEVVGNVASGAADTGKPVKIGGKYNATLPTFTDGQRGDAQLDNKGSIRVVSTGIATNGIDGYSNGGLVAYAGNNAQNADKLLITAGFAYNGTSWDRIRGDTNGVKVTNSQNNIGNVGGKTVSVTVTPTVTATNSYGVNYVVGGLLTFANMFTSTGTGIIQSVDVNIKKNETGGFTLFLFSANPSATTWTDAAVAAINATDIPLVRAPISLTSNTQLAATGFTNLSATGLAIAMAPGATTLYAVLIANAALSTQFGSTSDVSVTIRALQDL